MSEEIRGNRAHVKDHICVCVCTYKRPALLGKLLTKLNEQITQGLFDYSVVVVDNDIDESGRHAVDTFSLHAKIAISYHVEPEQNIALARNRAIDNTRGQFIALIDDDELPTERWLLNHFKALKEYGSDGTLGPVLPFFEKEPPKWVLKGRLFDRPTHPTGHILDWQFTRSGNALLRSNLFRERGVRFNPAFGRGGEDRDLFRRLIEMGHIFVWTNAAPVHEIVPPKRWERTVLLKRALLRGKMSLNSPDSMLKSVLKSLLAIVGYTMSLPISMLLGHHVFMKHLIRDCDHIGKVLALLGIDIVTEKYV